MINLFGCHFNDRFFVFTDNDTEDPVIGIEKVSVLSHVIFKEYLLCHTLLNSSAHVVTWFR